jgi:S-adenosylmethionine-diacylglycerol 3-amino-3-carboxypropyl transferase
MTTNAFDPLATADTIRYAQCWEDADVLLEALDIRPGDVCLSIASAGDNTLALLTRDPGRVVAIDLSSAQLHCLALRVAAYRRLEHTELLELMGSRPSRDRRALFERCRPELAPDTIAFWQRRWPEAERWGIGGVGRLEGYFRCFRRWILPLVHRAATVDALLRRKSRDERARFYTQRWHTPAWRMLLKTFFCRTVMARFGREREFFRHADGDVAAHVERRIAHALRELDPADNPYLHWILTGRHGATLPLALRPEHFATIRANLDRLEWRRESLQDFTRSRERVDACNLSDVFEYLSESEHERLYAALLDCTRAGTRLAYWNWMVPRAVPHTQRRRVDCLTTLANRLGTSDKAFVYSRFVVEVAR